MHGYIELFYSIKKDWDTIVIDGSAPDCKIKLLFALSYDLVLKTLIIVKDRNAMLDTYILKIDRIIEKDNFDSLLSCVSEEKKNRISRFHRFEDAQRSLLGDVLARYAICKRLGVKNKDLVFGENEYGKPILIAPSRIHFNISHSGNWVACAIDENQVGIDVEVIKPISFKIADRFFSRDEYLALLSQPEEMRLKYFYMIWTLKESYIKADGKGLSIPLNSFSVRIEVNDISVTVGNEVREFYFHQSFLDSDAVYAVCTLSNNNNKSMYRNIESFLKKCKILFYHCQLEI